MTSILSMASNRLVLKKRGAGWTSNSPNEPHRGKEVSIRNLGVGEIVCVGVCNVRNDAEGLFVVLAFLLVRQP